ncbi:MAG: glutamine--fructose-6-phosphate transaminase (isomerizing) [Patescibacteria group bacterium]
MCGIVGYTGKSAVQGVLKGLDILKYRGYDSAGISLMLPSGIKIIKMALRRGNFQEFYKKVKEQTKKYDCMNAIGHTRWATHGDPSVINAHPHQDCTGKISLVHNGVLENYRELKKSLIKEGCRFASDTDTEVICHLLEFKLRKTKGDIRQAISETVRLLRGTFGLLIQHADYPSMLIGMRLGSTLSYIQTRDGAFMVASTAEPFCGYAKRCKHLRDREIVIINNNKVEELSFTNDKVSIPTVTFENSIEEVGLNGFPHFMLKEIMLQPDVLADTLRGRINVDTGKIKLGGLEAVRKKLLRIKHFFFIGSGTSYHAALIIAQMFRNHLGVHAEAKSSADVAFDNIFAGCEPSKVAVFAVSQSGETADLLKVVRELKIHGVRLVLGIVNSVGSTLSQLSDGGVYLRVGPEIGVASTKAFSGQVLVGVMITLWLAEQYGIAKDSAIALVRSLDRIPNQLKQVLAQAEQIKSLANRFKQRPGIMVLGSGYHKATAYEGGLKVAEVAYVYREVQSATEMKHGPIALINKGHPVIMIATQDSHRPAVMNSISEVKSRGAFVVGICTNGDKEMASQVDRAIFIPKAPPELSTVLVSTILQLMAYYLGVLRGNNVDLPRNLAKSVTV